MLPSTSVFKRKGITVPAKCSRQKMIFLVSFFFSLIYSIFHIPAECSHQNCLRELQDPEIGGKNYDSFHHFAQPKSGKLQAWQSLDRFLLVSFCLPMICPHSIAFVFLYIYCHIIKHLQCIMPIFINSFFMHLCT